MWAECHARAGVGQAPGRGAQHTSVVPNFMTHASPSCVSFPAPPMRSTCHRGHHNFGQEEQEPSAGCICESPRVHLGAGGTGDCQHLLQESIKCHAGRTGKHVVQCIQCIQALTLMQASFPCIDPDVCVHHLHDKAWQQPNHNTDAVPSAIDCTNGVHFMEEKDTAHPQAQQFGELLLTQ